jgi:peptidoglycan/LPS O-acetylase OafA/YrhL
MQLAHKADRSEALDAVRGAAVGLVLIWHLVEPYLRENYPDFAWTLGLTWSGVDLFFVLSGFLIGGLLMDHRGSERLLATFYARRACRIIPLYALLLTAFALSSPGQNLWPYVTFTQNFVMANSASWGPVWLVPTWSLAVEEQFYFLLPAVIILMPRSRLPYLLVFLIAISPGTRLVLRAIYGNPFAPYLLLPGRMDALFLGVLAAWLIRHPPSLQWLAANRRKLYVATGVAFLFLVVLSRLRPGWFSAVTFAVGYSSINLFYFLIVVLIATTQAQVPRLLKPLSWMGLGAYSLYLFHVPLVRQARLYLPSYPDTIAMIALVLLSTLLWHLVEKPIVAFGHRRFRYGITPYRPGRDGELQVAHVSPPSRSTSDQCRSISGQSADLP